MPIYGHVKADSQMVNCGGVTLYLFGIWQEIEFMSSYPTYLERLAVREVTQCRDIQSKDDRPTGVLSPLSQTGKDIYQCVVLR